MDVNETINPNNAPALGRFQPGYVDGGAGQGEIDVTLATNLAGEPIRFTFNESLDSIVSNGTLTMLNAIIGDDGEQQVGIMGEVKTEEDTAKWGTLYASAPVEPNQLVTVTESGGGLGTCTTNWRVIGVTSYLDENDIPYYDVQLEGLGQIANSCRFDPAKEGVNNHNFLRLFRKSYWEGFLEKKQEDSIKDGYKPPEGGDQETWSEGARLVVATPSEWLAPFLKQIDEAGGDLLTCGTAVDIGDYIPNYCNYIEGSSCWDVIETMFGFAGKMVRFDRAGRLIVIDSFTGGDTGWSYLPTDKDFDGSPIHTQEDLDNPPLPKASIGDFGQGLQLAYSKDGVYSWAYVTGQINGKPEERRVPSSAGNNILNGEVVILTVSVDENYDLTTLEQLYNYGMKELYKSIIGARSATYDSNIVPLSVEVGMTLGGSSKLGGATSIFITALNRTTDAQQNTIQTGISGTRVFSGGSTSNDMGWS